MRVKVGFGFDVHQLKDNVDFFLGGIKIPHNKGAFGHSDADVLIHAICDALLGASSLGDIGTNFPDTSEEYRNIDSKILLNKVVQMVQRSGFQIGNIDATICLQYPKISTLIPEMKKTLANCMSLDINDVSIKATTTEKLGFVGRQEGVSAYAIALVHS